MSTAVYPHHACPLLLSLTHTYARARSERTHDGDSGQGDSQDGHRCAAGPERDRNGRQHVLRNGA